MDQAMKLQCDVYVQGRQVGVRAGSYTGLPPTGGSTLTKGVDP